MSLFKYLFRVAIACLLLSACTTLEVDVASRATATPIVPHVTSTDTVLPLTSTPIQTTPIPAPEANQFYLGTLLGQPVLFVRTSGQQSALAVEPYLGSVVDEEGNNQGPFDLRKIDSPRLVFTGGSEPIAYNFKVDPITRLIYLSSFYIDPVRQIGYVKNPIIEIEHSPLARRQVWVYETGQDRYPGYKGGGFLDQAVGGFLVLKLYPCFACDFHTPTAALIVNTTTGAERLLGQVDEVRLNVHNRTVEYRRLQPVRKKCEASPICDPDGYFTTYEPAGDAISEPLP